jgi:cell division protein FtsL
MTSLDPIYVPLLTFLGTLLIVAVGILFNNSRITDIKGSFVDLKDLIKAESRVTEANSRRLEEKIEKVENLLLTRLADHDTRIGRLESK